MKVSEDDVPAVLARYLKSMRKTLICIQSLKYHEYKDELKPLLKAGGMLGYDDKTWFADVRFSNDGDGNVEILRFVCDAKTGECQTLYTL